MDAFSNANINGEASDSMNVDDFGADRVERSNSLEMEMSMKGRHLIPIQRTVATLSPSSDSKTLRWCIMRSTSDSRCIITIIQM